MDAVIVNDLTTSFRWLVVQAMSRKRRAKSNALLPGRPCPAKDRISQEEHLLTYTCVGIHPGRVEPASPIAMTTSRTEAHQARRSCASSLDTFTQSFFHRAWPKTRGPEIGSRSALIVVAHVSRAPSYFTYWLTRFHIRHAIVVRLHAHKVDIVILTLEIAGSVGV